MWRTLLGQKYTSLPGVRKLHDFIVVRNGNVVMKVRESIYTGGWDASPLTISDPSLPESPTDTYSQHTDNQQRKDVQHGTDVQVSFSTRLSSSFTLTVKLLLPIPSIHT